MRRAIRRNKVIAGAEPVKAARRAPAGLGLEGRAPGGNAGGRGAWVENHAPLPRGEREEGLGGGTPSHFSCPRESLQS